MGIEKRKSRRTDVNVYISLRQLDDKYVSGYAGDTVDVNVINISKDGMAFKSDYKFKQFKFSLWVLRVIKQKPF